MEQALLITGDTYTSRREIKALGGKWYPDRTGWIVPIAQAEKLKPLAARGFAIEEIQVEPEALERPTGERLRAIRQARLDRKHERRLARADRLEQQAGQIEKTIQPYMNLEFLTEPIKIGHHSEKRHRRVRERLSQQIGKKFELLSEAEKLREPAPQARIAGDAARRDQAIREKHDQVIAVGSRVTDLCFGTGEVVRVNKKSYTVKWDRGSTFARDKIFVRPA